MILLVFSQLGISQRRFQENLNYFLNLTLGEPFINNVYSLIATVIS